MVMSVNAEIDMETTLAEIKDQQGIKWILDELSFDEDSLLDEFYFSEILDKAIERDQTDVESDIANSQLDLVSVESIYDPSNLDDIQKFLTKAFKKRSVPESVLRVIKNEAAEHGWDLVFTKKI